MYHSEPFPDWSFGSRQIHFARWSGGVNHRRGEHSMGRRVTNVDLTFGLYDRGEYNIFINFAQSL
jgi:hypothetical protein